MKRSKGGETEAQSLPKHVKFTDPEDEALSDGQAQIQPIQVILASEEQTRPKKDWQQVDEKAYSEREVQYLDEQAEQQFEPFNLDAERALGDFDEQGSFTWKRRDLDDDGDEAWLAQVGNTVAKKPQSSVASSEAEQEEIHVPKSLWNVIKHLNPNENPLSALKRLKNSKKSFDELTSECARLLANGLMDVYTSTREVLAKKLKPLQWEYKVVNEAEIHGPFLGTDMQSWRDDGFFQQDSAEHCLVRVVSSETHDQGWLRDTDVATFLLTPDEV